MAAKQIVYSEKSRQAILHLDGIRQLIDTA